MPAAGAGERVDQREKITDVDVGADGTGIDRALEEGGPGGGDHRVTGLQAAVGSSVVLGRHLNGQPVVHRGPRAGEPEPRDQRLRRAVAGRQRLRGVAASRSSFT